MALNPKQRKLNPKQKRFVDEYLIDLNMTQAAIRAGYSKKTAPWIGQRLFSKSHIEAAIQEALKAREERTELSADYVIKGLLEVHKKCSEPIPVLDRQGNPTGEYRFDSSGANKALELLGKNLQMFTDRVKLEADSPILFKVVDDRTYSKPTSDE